MNFEIKIFKNFDSEVEKLWNEFENQSHNYCFQNFYWLKNWYLNLDNSKKIEIFNILIFQHKKLVLIAPLCVEVKEGIKILQWQGGDRSDFMCGLTIPNNHIDKKDFKEIWKKIKKEIKIFDIVYFKRQPKKIHNTSNPFFSYLKNNEDYVIRSITLEKSFNFFLEKNIKSKFISDTKRRINGLKKIGELDFKIINNDENLKIRSTVKTILYEKILRLEKYNLKHPFNESAKKFYINFDNKCFKNGNLHVSVLSVNQHAISYHWGVVYKGAFYHLLPTITDSDYNKYAPGRIHLQKLIEWSISNNILKFDFTIGDEEYKKDWSNYNENLYSYTELNNVFYVFQYIFLYLKILIKRFNIFTKVF